MERIKTVIKNICITWGFFIIGTIIGWLFKKAGFTEPNIVVIYILSVLFTARLTEGYAYGLIASVISIMGFNYYFTAPYHTFNVYDPSYFVTFAIMAITSFVTSTLTSKTKMYIKKAEEKEAESRALYTLTNQLSDAEDIDKIIEIGLDNICSLLQMDAGFIYFKEKDQHIFIQQNGREQVHRTTEETTQLWELMKNLHTEYAEEKDYIDFPVIGNDRLLGVVRLEKQRGMAFDLEKKRMLHSMIENIAIALDRIVVIQERILDREAVVRERYRANLLRAISHDLRTPLTGIMGAAEMLIDMTENKDRRYDMMVGIFKDADWLHAMVENILSLTRLQDGNMEVKKEPEALEEVIASAISHVEKMHPEREIQVILPEEFLLVPMDARLIEQVINNLLDNAIKHTTADEKISIIVRYTDEVAQVCVRDEGEGIPSEDEKNIFQIFYTTQTRGADAKKGVGLGLSICDTVLKAHNGKISGGNRKDTKGAEFIFELPLNRNGSEKL